MKIIVGLGNPGKDYAHSRHNLGFQILEEFQNNFRGNFSNFKKNSELQSEISEGKIEQEKIILVKPLGFYNNSGPIVKKILNYFKLTPQDLIVIHDDLDLPLGRFKITQNSNSAGNNGVQSLIETFKTKNFLRIRVGTANELKEKVNSQDFVLKNFNRQDKKYLKEVIPLVQQAIIDLVEHFPNIEQVQNTYH